MKTILLPVCLFLCSYVFCQEQKNLTKQVFAETPFKIIKGYKKTLDDRSRSSSERWRSIKTSFSFPSNTFKNIVTETGTNCVTALISFRGNSMNVDFVGTDRKGKVSPKNKEWKARKTEHGNFKRLFRDKNGYKYPYNLRNFTVSVVIPYTEIETLIKEAGNPKKVGVYLGIEPAKAKKKKNIAFEHVTVCFFGATDNGDPVDAHTRISDPVAGRQTWPIDSFEFVEKTEGSIELTWPADANTVTRKRKS